MKQYQSLLHLSELNFIFKFFDTIRSYLLKQTMQSDFLKTVFVNRAYRLLTFFLLSTAFNLFLALRLPLWSLLLGPLILGVPHLISTMRYIPKLTQFENIFSAQKLYYACGGLFVGIALMRLFFLNQSVTLLENLPNAIELVFMFTVFLIMSLCLKQNLWRIACSTLLLAGLFVFSVKYPMETLGFLVIAHNFVGFFYWIARTSSPKDKLSAGISLFVFAGLSALMLLGAFDSLMTFRSSDILRGLFSEASVGSQIMQGADALLLARIVSVYAFGQGLHYFVWLKAIPEQELPFEHSVSFSSSFKLLKSDISLKMLYLTGIILLCLLGWSILKNIPEARMIYIGLAAFHGYLEIAALTFVKTKTS